MKKTLIFFTINLLFLIAGAFSQSYSLYFYGVVSNVNDENMIKVTQDLFAAQIRNLNGIILIDERNSPVKASLQNQDEGASAESYFSLINPDNSPNAPQSGNQYLSFFSKIYRPQSDENWRCTFYLKNYATGEIRLSENEYDSYYKILSEAKNSILKLIADSTNLEADSSDGQQARQNTQKAASAGVSLENIAGTWSGEKNVSKIVLMRSGRGFVIFNNGATMNISISISGDDEGAKKLKIMQEGKFNASFFPEIPRQNALEYAETAPSIEWNLALTSGGELKGTKKTLVPHESTFKEGSVDVTWYREQSRR